MQLGLSLELLGRTFNGLGKVIDGFGDIFIEKYEKILMVNLKPYFKSLS